MSVDGEQKQVKSLEKTPWTLSFQNNASKEAIHI